MGGDKFNPVVSPVHLRRIQKDWSEYAKEDIVVDESIVGEPINGLVITVFGSEVACLRLYYRFFGRGRVEYSQNLGTWFYVNRDRT